MEFEHSNAIAESPIDACIEEAERSLDSGNIGAALWQLGKAVELTEGGRWSGEARSTMRVVRLLTVLHRCKATRECTSAWAAKTGDLSRRVLEASAVSA